MLSLLSDSLPKPNRSEWQWLDPPGRYFRSSIYCSGGHQQLGWRSVKPAHSGLGWAGDRGQNISGYAQAPFLAGGRVPAEA